MTKAQFAMNETYNNDIAVAQNALDLEIKGLSALKDSLGHDFLTAIDAIQKMKDDGRGRLIVSGIGKSGHVARKIAATLASTGTPSYYIHPAEASHGDLGMISEHDVVLLLSNSGENAELTDMIAYARRFSIPLIALTSNENGALAKHSNIALVMPKMAEACPNGLAPTTSTTMMMAYGDALAIALLQRMNLTPDQFRVFHPGGKLGQKLRRVIDVMVKGDEVPFVKLGVTMDQALITLSEKNMGSVIIVDDAHHLKGIITDGDLKRHMRPDLLSQKVDDVMTKSPRFIVEDKLAVEAVDIMIKQPKTPITSLVVCNEAGKATGLLRIQDLLKLGIV
jgi:arabinose-5-phosphate isomerase